VKGHKSHFYVKYCERKLNIFNKLVDISDPDSRSESPNFPGRKPVFKHILHKLHCSKCLFCTDVANGFSRPWTGREAIFARRAREARSGLHRSSLARSGLPRKRESAGRGLFHKILNYVITSLEIQSLAFDSSCSSTD
jgi:hypothetical protein